MQELNRKTPEKDCSVSLFSLYFITDKIQVYNLFYNHKCVVGSILLKIFRTRENIQKNTTY
jgi:hypothetical protein